MGGPMATKEADIVDIFDWPKDIRSQCHNAEKIENSFAQLLIFLLNCFNEAKQAHGN